MEEKEISDILDKFQLDETPALPEHTEQLLTPPPLSPQEQIEQNRMFASMRYYESLPNGPSTHHDF